MRKLKKNHVVAVAVLAFVAIATGTSAYYLITKNQVNADTSDPGFPAMPPVPGAVQTATTPPIVTATPLKTSTATSFSDPSQTQVSAYANSNTSAASPSSTNSYNQTSVAITTQIASTAIPASTDTSLISQTIVPATLNQDSLSPTSTAVAQTSSSFPMLLIIIAVIAVGGALYLIFRKKPNPQGNDFTLGSNAMPPTPQPVVQPSPQIVQPQPTPSPITPPAPVAPPQGEQTPPNSQNLQ